MTGFGSAEADVGGRRARVEVRTVNHRFHHASVRLPADLAALEGEVREALKRRIDRGHVTLTLTWVDAPEVGVSVDWQRAGAAVELLREMRDRFHLAGDVGIEQVLRFPDVLAAAPHSATLEWGTLEPLVGMALDECLAARRREGAQLSAELEERLAALEAHAAVVASLLPARLEREVARLREGVATLAAGVQVDEARLAQEVAVLADKLDVREELVRLRAHVAAAREAVSSDRPVGKQLGFLAQELGREVNTVGSKANDIAIAHEVVAMKGELEKVREQLENLE